MVSDDGLIEKVRRSRIDGCRMRIQGLKRIASLFSVGRVRGERGPHHSRRLCCASDGHPGCGGRGPHRSSSGSSRGDRSGRGRLSSHAVQPYSRNDRQSPGAGRRECRRARSWSCWTVAIFERTSLALRRTSENAKLSCVGCKPCSPRCRLQTGVGERDPCVQSGRGEPEGSPGSVELYSRQSSVRRGDHREKSGSE